MPLLQRQRRMPARREQRVYREPDRRPSYYRDEKHHSIARWTESVQSSAGLQHRDHPDSSPMRHASSLNDAKHVHGRACTDESDFNKLFPSARKMVIAHDELSSDTEKNLCVTTSVTSQGHQRIMQLFHLRMYNLQSRYFALRRHGRDSGCRVCQTSRRPASDPQASSSASVSTLEFSDKNKTRLDLKSRAASQQQRGRHEFRHDGTEYTWKRTVGRTDSRTMAVDVEFTLTARPGSSGSAVGRTGWSRDQVLATMAPEPCSPRELRNALRDGFVRPTSLRFDNACVVDLTPNLADIIVATGLVALLDDCLARLEERSRLLVGGPSYTFHRALRAVHTDKSVADSVDGSRLHSTVSGGGNRRHVDGTWDKRMGDQPTVTKRSSRPVKQFKVSGVGSLANRGRRHD